MAKHSLTPLVAPLGVGLVAIAYFASQNPDSPTPVVQTNLGPPNDVSREFAKQLIEGEPFRAGEKMPLPDWMINCFRREGIMQGGIAFGLTNKGRQYFQDVNQLSLPGHFDVIPNRDIRFQYVRVSGVRTVSGGRKLIEFSGNIKFGNFAGVTGCIQSLSGRKRTAVAEKYDDGWRVRFVNVQGR